jgi:hypothetical protein
VYLYLPCFVFFTVFWIVRLSILFLPVLHVLPPSDNSIAVNNNNNNNNNNNKTEAEERENNRLIPQRRQYLPLCYIKLCGQHTAHCSGGDGTYLHTQR